LRYVSGTVAAGWRFPCGHEFAPIPSRRAGPAAAGRVRCRRPDCRRPLRCYGRIDRAERGRRRGISCMRHLPWSRRTRQWRWHAAACGPGQGISCRAARRLCERSQAASRNGSDRAQADAGTAAGRFRLLCRPAVRSWHRATASAGHGGTALPSRRCGARTAFLCLVPRRPGRGDRPCQSAAWEPARAVSRRAARSMASERAAQRSRQRHAGDQPATFRSGIFGSRGLCCPPPREASASGISGSIPRSTS
jgi:hypothetical protein